MSRNPGTPTCSSTSVTVRPSTPGVPAPGIPRDPVERHDQRRRVIHEVEQVVEPAARIGRRPTVKLGLHLRYPRPRANLGRVESAVFRRRVFRHYNSSSPRLPLPPFAMWPARRAGHGPKPGWMGSFCYEIAIEPIVPVTRHPLPGWFCTT
jgi:hypothetical protein